MNIEHRTSNIERRTLGSWLLRAVLGVFAAGTVLAANSGAQETNTNYPPLNSFSIIGTRNIFNPNRTGYIPRERFGNQRQRVNAFALVGTMSYSKGRFAFFDGSNPQYKKVLEAGGTIAGYTVKEVTQTNVTLSANGKDFGMPVGSQMRNEGGTKWSLSGHIIEEADETNGETNAENATAESSAPPTGGSPEMNDILKQMAERRKQELK